MKQLTENILLILASCILFVFFFIGANADHDHDHDECKSKYLKTVDNETYKNKCGSCHYSYQPGLLPSGSWEKILDNLSSHFSKKIKLDEKLKKEIAQYLKTNAAEHSTAKRAVKILKSLNGKTPLRISGTPYIRDKHHEIKPDTFKRESIGSFSNCIACHLTAEKGVYDNDFVKIPK